MRNIIFACLILVSCTSSAPKRDFEVILYESDYNCLEYSKNGEIFTTCRGEQNHPKKVIGIRAEDYAKERKYQATLKNACKKWKD